MSIFEELYTSFVNAVNEYKTQKTYFGKSIPPRRVSELEQLENILSISNTPNNRDALLLRKKVVTFVNQIDVHPLAFLFSNLDSELRKNLKGILANPAYHEEVLVAKERAEAKQRDVEARQRDIEAKQRDEEAKQRDEIIIAHLNASKVIELIDKVETLTQDINTKNNQLNRLQNTIKTRYEAYNRLKTNYEKIKTENRELKTENNKLAAENNLLKEQLANSEKNNTNSSNNFNFC